MTKTYFPLHSHSHFSILDGIAQPHQIVDRLKEIGCSGSALTDHGSISGAIQFLLKMQDGGLKPIIGVEMYVSDDDATIKNASNRSLSHLLILAKNDQGWRQLVKLISEANKPEHFYYRPRLSLEQLSKFLDGNLIGISGHLGSHIAKCYDVEDEQERSELGVKLALYLQQIFGEGNFFLEVQLIDSKNSPDAVKVAQYVREISKVTGIKCVGTPDSHYCRRKDAEDQRVVLCVNMHKTLAEASSDSGLRCFFDSDSFHIPTYDEMIECGNTEEELSNTLLVAEMCTEYKDIFNDPVLPRFDCPNGKTEDEYLKELCDIGWKEKIENIIPKDQQQVYIDRMTEELSVIQEAKMSGYFLIVQDILKYCRNNKWIVGVGRGCLLPNTQIYLSTGELINIEDCLNKSIIIKNGQSALVHNVYKYNIKEQINKIYTYYGDSRGTGLTLDHMVLGELVKKIPIKSKGRQRTQKIYKKNISWHETKSLSVGDFLVLPIPKEYEHINVIDMSLYHNNNKDNLTYDNDFCCYWYQNRLTGTKTNIQKYKRYINKDENFYKILGLFTGDGWLNNNIDTRFGIAFNRKSKLQNLIFTEEYFKKLGIKTTRRYHKKSDLIQLDIYSYHFVQYIKKEFNNYKRTSDTKHVPLSIIKEHPKYIKSYIIGYLESDGSVINNSYRFSTVSLRLAEQIRFLLMKIGKPSSLQISDRKPDPRGYPVKRCYYIKCPAFHVIENNYFYTTDDFIAIRIRKIEQYEHNGYVYDLSINHKKEHNFLTSSFLVHNSAAGCLISYLIGITQVDSIKYSLLFSRFYDPSRKSSPPDCDIDIPKFTREKVIQYLKNKYGHDKISGMITYQTMKGRGALKDVLRTYGIINFEEMNRITKLIPDEAKISGELQKMKEESGESSIILYALENERDARKDTTKKNKHIKNKETLEEWCYLDDDDNLRGPLSKHFEQAIRLEKTKTSQSKHAAGIALSPKPLHEICPMIYDPKENTVVAGLEMNDLEKIGVVKLDLLGIAMLDKIMGVKEILAYGDIADGISKE